MQNIKLQKIIVCFTNGFFFLVDEDCSCKLNIVYLLDA